jgi:hypothetical protein
VAPQRGEGSGLGGGRVRGQQARRVQGAQGGHDFGPRARGQLPGRPLQRRLCLAAGAELCPQIPQRRAAAVRQLRERLCEVPLSLALATGGGQLICQSLR